LNQKNAKDVKRNLLLQKKSKASKKKRSKQTEMEKKKVAGDPSKKQIKLSEKAIE
jgi:hypothetical protein